MALLGTFVTPCFKTIQWKELVFVIGIDPGVKYVGLASGLVDECYGTQLDLHPELKTVFSVVEQHWDLIQWIYYYHYQDKYRNSACKINIEFSQDKTFDGKHSEFLTLVCIELEKRLHDWQKQKKAEVYTYNGLETHTKRREIGLNKGKAKNKHNIMAHINDARTLWAFGFDERYSQWSGICDLASKPEYLEYHEWSNLIINDHLELFKKRLVDLSTRLAAYENSGMVLPCIIDKCLKPNASKVDILKYWETMTFNISSGNPLIKRIN